MSLKINKIIFALTLILCIGFVNAFEVSITAPNQEYMTVANEIQTISATVGVVANCSYDVAGLIGEYVNDSNSPSWNFINISSLADGNWSINVSCVESTNSLNSNFSIRNITKYTQAPSVYWFNPNDNNDFDLGESVELFINFTSGFGIDNSNNNVFIISCDNGDNGSLSGNPSYADINMLGAPNVYGNITQTWTTPSVASTCTILANVSNGLSTFNSTESISLNIYEMDYIKDAGVEFGDELFTLIGNINEFNLTGLFIEANSTDSFAFNMTHGGICMGIDPMSFPASLANYNFGEGLWESEPPASNICSINFENIIEGENLLIFDLFLNNSVLTTQVNYSVYYDPTMPEIHFDWWNTFGWNETDNTTYALTLPDYKNLISDEDIFYAPNMMNDEIHIALNATDAAVYNGTIDRAFASFTGLNLGQTTTCIGQIPLTYNLTTHLWEGNCSLGDFSPYLNLGEVVTGNITFTVYDAYNNTNMFSYYNLSDSSQVCMGENSNCMPLHVPINLHNFGQIKSNDDCMQFNGLTTNLSEEEDFSDINLVLDVYINLSCDYEDPSLPDSMQRMITFNFTSVDFSNPSASGKLMNLIDAIDFDFSLPNQTGKSLIYINSSAFAELDTNTTVSMYHIPLSDEPTILAEIPANLNDTSIVWVSNGLDAFYSNQFESGNLTFDVFGFSGYDIYDNDSPIINITMPVNNIITSNSNVFVNATINGTGSFVKFVNFNIDGTDYVYTYGAGVGSANCTKIGTTEEIMTCVFTHNITSGDASYALSVLAGDFGGDNGLNTTQTVNLILDTVQPNATEVVTPAFSSGWVGEQFYNFTFSFDDDSNQNISYDFWIGNVSADARIWPDGYSITGSIAKNQLISIVSNLTSVVEGDQLFWYLFIMDEAGNGVTYNDTFSLDYTDATTTVTGNNSNWTHASYYANLSATDTASGVATIYYKVGTGSIQSVNDDNVSIFLNESGEYNVTFWSVDIAGNVESNNTFVVKIDQNAPITTNDVPSGWQNSDFTITLSPSDVGTGVNHTSYSINGSALVNGTSIAISTEGAYNVTYYSVDNAGLSENITTILVQLDKTTPSVLVSNNQSTTTDTDYNVTLTATDILSGVLYINYSIDGGAWVQVMNSTALVLINQEGEYNVTYYAVDNAGNIGTDENFSVSHDSTAPITTVSGNNSNWRNSNFTVTFSAIDGLSGVNYTEYNINNAGWVELVGTDLNITLDGEYNVSFRSNDLAGNLEEVKTFLVRLDKIGPIGLSDNAPVGLQTSAFNVTLVVNDSISGINYYNYSINGGANQTGNVILFTTEGEYNVTYYAVDNADNIATEENFTVTLDNTAPTTSDNAPSGWQTSDFTITLSPTDGLTGVNNTYYSIDGDVEQTGTSIAITTEGEYNVTYYSVDNANNPENTNTVLVQLDKTAPTLNITSPLNQTYTSSTISLTKTNVDAISGINATSCVYSLDGAAYATCPASLTSLGDGSHTLIVNISDDAGNMASENVTFEVQEPPRRTLIRVKLPMEYNDTNNYWFNVTLSDNTGIDMARLNLNGTWYNMTDRGANLWTYNETNLSSGVYSYYFRANDTSNNIWTSINSTFTIRALEVYEEIINESNFVVPVNATNLIVDTLKNVTIPSSSTSTVTLDLSNSVSNGEVTLVEQVVMKRESSTVNLTVQIPAGTRLNASSSWNGKLIMPEVETGVDVPTGQEGTVDLAVKMGSEMQEISFDQAVKITLPGQANKSAAWKRGSGALTVISTTCDDVANPTNIDPVNTRICKVNSGSDLLIFTYHFTTFAAGTWTTPSSGSSGGGGSSNDIYNMNDLQKGEAKGQTLRVKDVIKFTQNNQNHRLTLNNIDYDAGMVTVTIESEPKVIDMYEGKVYEVDVDDNGMYDTKVWFEFNSKSRAIVYLMAIDEVYNQADVEKGLDSPTMPIKEIKDEPTPQVKDENIDTAKIVNENIDVISEDNIQKEIEEETKFSYLTLVIILVILISLGITSYFIFFKK